MVFGIVWRWFYSDIYDFGDFLEVDEDFDEDVDLDYKVGFIV